MQAYPSCIIHADHTVEYANQIDLRAAPGLICTIIKTSDVASFVTGVLDYGLSTCFIQSTKPVGSAARGGHVWYVFRLYPSVNKVNGKQATQDLIRFLWMGNYPIIWKEDKHGYEIDDAGRILRKWDLEPF